MMRSWCWRTRTGITRSANRRITAAFDGAAEVTIPVLVATLTTIIVLCPIALMPGMGGFLFRPLTLAVAFAMIASFILSRTLVPALCAKWIRAISSCRARSTNRRAGGGEFTIASKWSSNSSLGVMSACWRSRCGIGRRCWSAWGCCSAARWRCCWGSGGSSFPRSTPARSRSTCGLLPGTNIEAAEQRVIEVEKFLRDHIPADERKMIISELGLVPDWSAAYTANSGTQDGTIKVQLSDERTKSAQEYAIAAAARLRARPQVQRFAGRASTRAGWCRRRSTMGLPRRSTCRSKGAASSKPSALAQQVRDQVAGIPGAADVHIQQRLDAPQRIIVVDRKKAADAGLDLAQVINQVATAMNSSVSIKRNFWIDYKSGNQYFVGVQYPENPSQRLEDVLDIPATGVQSDAPGQAQQSGENRAGQRPGRGEPREPGARVRRAGEHRRPRYRRRGR